MTALPTSSTTPQYSWPIAIGALIVVQTTERPEIGAADAGRRKPDDGVGRLLNFWLGDFFAAHVARAVKQGGFHSDPLLDGLFAVSKKVMPASIADAHEWPGLLGVFGSHQ